MHAPDDRGSISDWLWCSACDVEFAKYRELKGETCVHCLFLVTKSWRAAKNTMLPMFDEGSLAPDYDLSGECRSLWTGARERSSTSCKSSERPLAIEDANSCRDDQGSHSRLLDLDNRAREQSAGGVHRVRSPGPPRNPGRTRFDLTEAERQELEDPFRYRS